MKKLLMTLGLATAGGALAFGAAAYLPVTSDTLGSGYAIVESCDEDGVHVSYELVDGEPQLVGAITVSGIAEGCMDKTLSWVIQDTSSVVMADGSGVVDDNTMTFELDDDLIAQFIGEVGITIAG
jgi:hypothetical protein